MYPANSRDTVARKIALAVLAMALTNGHSARADGYQRTHITPTPIEPSARYGMFGVETVVLPNGNVVVADPWYSIADHPRVGSVSLYRSDGSLISMLRGSRAGDRVGGFDDTMAKGNITVLANGHFVVGSLNWRQGTGAATWSDADVGWGLDKVVELSAQNSIVGDSPGDQVGGTITALANGHYVVASPGWDDGGTTNAGAVTWADGFDATAANVSASNSLVGSHAFDHVGSITVLGNGNYVVSSPLWDDGAIRDVGVAAWCPGTSGCMGRMEDSGILKGSRTSDHVAGSVVALADGDYVVISAIWKNNDDVPVGAATYRSGTEGLQAVVSLANSLHGSRLGDFGVIDHGPSVVPLSNGNWVLVLPAWDAPWGQDVGAVAWMEKGGGGTGEVSEHSALVGSAPGDGTSLWTVALTNGHYVAGFPHWDDARGIVPVADVGAVVWGDGDSGGITGRVDPDSNALIGRTAGDRIGLVGRATPLVNGDYVVLSPYWDLVDVDRKATDAGAATRCDGSGSTTGIVSAANSLHGSSSDDFVNFVVALEDGAYVVLTPSWDSKTASNVGAATWCPTSGCTGSILASNSLTGSMANDAVGNGAIALADGAYVVLSWNWNDNRGAVTWHASDQPATGSISPENSLVGASPNDALGFGFNHLGTFKDGSYLVQNREWDGPHEDAGAIVLARPDGRSVGPLSTNRVDLIAGHSANSASYTRWHYGDATRVLAVGDYLSQKVTLLQWEDAIFRGDFESSGQATSGP